MREGILACPVHDDNETTPNCPDCRPYMMGRGGGQLIQKRNSAKKSEDFYKYDCTCGGEVKYVSSEWRWKCEKCGAINY